MGLRECTHICVLPRNFRNSSCRQRLRFHDSSREVLDTNNGVGASEVYEWEPVELITSGTLLQAACLPFGWRTRCGVETKIVFGGQTMVHAKVRFNEPRCLLKWTT